MASYKDQTGREWGLTITVGHITAFRTEAGVDLSSAMKSEAAASQFFEADPSALVRMLWCLCERQAEKANVTPEDFGYLFDGPTREAAENAFLEAFIDFRHRSKIAAAMKANLPKVLERAETAAVEWISKQFAGNSPVSSASIPGP